MEIPPEFRARFERNYVPEPNSGCWLWLGAMANCYGMICIDGKNYRAHRVSYQMANGSLPPGKVVMHVCDNKACVNPDHLLAGSHADNVRDYHRKIQSGEASFLLSAGDTAKQAGPLRKLTDGQVLAIRACNASNRAIAAEAGVDHTTIGLIKRRLAYSVIAEQSVLDKDLASRLDGLPSPMRARAAERRALATAMRANGATFATIGRQLGVTRSKAFELARPITVRTNP